jgi:hypothetical protein
VTVCRGQRGCKQWRSDPRAECAWEWSETAQVRWVHDDEAPLVRVMLLVWWALRGGVTDDCRGRGGMKVMVAVWR